MGPPPGMNIPPPSVPPPNFSAPPPASDDFDPTGEDQFDYYGGGYEPTQESQWVAPPSTYLGSGDNPDAPPGDADTKISVTHGSVTEEEHPGSHLEGTGDAGDHEVGLEIVTEKGIDEIGIVVSIKIVVSTKIVNVIVVAIA